MRQRLIDYLVLTFVGALYAVALKYFVLPSKVILTGMEGIASSLSYFYDSYFLFIVLYLIFHAVLLTFALVKVSRLFALRSSWVVLVVFISLLVLPDLQIAGPQNERLILVIFGGLLTGSAKALAFQRRGSTGDEDILAAYFAMKYLKPVGVIAVIAAAVSTAVGLVLEYIENHQISEAVNTLMYTCVYIFASSETLNNFYRRFKLTMIVVVTTVPDKIGKAIVAVTAHRTHTAERVLGGRSGQEFTAVRSIMTHEELPVVLGAIQQADPTAFFYFHDIDGVSRKYFIPPIG